MKRLSIALIALLILVSFLTAQVKWVSVDGVTKKPAPIQVKLLNATAEEIKFEVTVPGYIERKVVLPDGKEAVMIHIPETVCTMEQGFPMLPSFAKPIKLADRCEAELKLLGKEEAEFKLSLPVVPSKGHFTRDIPEASVPFAFGPVYKQDVFWPAEKDQFKLGKSFLLRNVHGAVFTMLPIRANHVQMKLQVVSKATFAIVCKEDGLMMATTRTPQIPSRTYQNLTSNFMGYEEPMPLRGDVPSENLKKLVVVTPSKFASTISSWVNWKKQCGYTVTVKEVADGVTASTIKSYLQGLYDNTDTRFGYVVLIGDASYNSNFEVAQPMPSFKGSMEGAAADRVYVRLAGADNYPDAFISRISATTETEITNQLTKIMEYEKGTYATGSWLNTGITIASNQGSPTDYERANWIINGGGTGQKVPIVTGGLSKFGYSFPTENKIYDPTASAAKVTAAVNTGAGIICYIGHGSDTSWGTTGFSVSNVNALTNGGKLPVIWSVACVNGNFLKVGTCFAEGWLRKANGGAVAMEAASTNESWVPPCDKQAATINAIINKKYSTFGALECEGVVAGLNNWSSTNSSEGNKMAEQCHLFGDCTMIVRTKAATALQVSKERGLDNNIVFNVMTEERSVADATVTVYNQDFSIMVSGETSEDGTVNIILPEEAANAELFYTVVGQDVIAIDNEKLN